MKIEIEIDDVSAQLIQKVIDETRTEQSTHGEELTLVTLTEMLLEDVALVVRRPGSWEGANMHSVLASHGYEF